MVFKRTDVMRYRKKRINEICKKAHHLQQIKHIFIFFVITQNWIKKIKECFCHPIKQKNVNSPEK